ncbi:hypothetical protein PIB30_042502 [Stylosanthes scabra]|uniref:Uncharacterized protein n=1 Tax=Stylosanthes scabra TaxID=79078 RepID=A0ABU6RFR5_9FABA|nr:hypothetical protein [Stylosanthes scabra]
MENVIDRSLLESHLESKDDDINKLPIIEESEKRMMEEAHLDYIYTGGPGGPEGPPPKH